MNVEDRLQAHFNKYKEEQPGLSWEETKKAYPRGSLVRGIVVTKEQFGVFVDIGVRFPALLLVPNFKNAKVIRYSMEMYPEVGSEVEAWVVGFNEPAQRIGLSQSEDWEA